MTGNKVGFIVPDETGVAIMPNNEEPITRYYGGPSLQERMIVAHGGGGGVIGRGLCIRINPQNKFAPVAPYHIYQQFLVNGYIPDTILLLAHDVVANVPEYKETFEHPEWANTTIIMDNSLVEMGGAVDIEMVSLAADVIEANVVVLPDVMGDGIKSAETTIDAWDQWAYKFKDRQKMVVIHGYNIPDWFKCAERLADKTKPDWVSIPRRAEGIKSDSGRVYTRSDLIPWVNRLFPKCPIHLLGFSDYIWEDIRAASHPSVRSIDSAVPLRMPETEYMLGNDAGPRGNWWETTKFKPEMIDNCQRIDQLIRSI